MENNPLISILCLCYNQEKFIVESLESIKAQTYKNFEILICDDYSKDKSVNIINEWFGNNRDLNVQFLIHTENKGICKSLNELLALSNGKYLQILALDDLLEKDKIERHVAILEKSNYNEVMVFSDAYLIDKDSKRFQNTFIPYHYKFLSLETGNYYNLLLADNMIPAMSGLMKSSIIKSIGGWDENLTFEDYDMWLRLSKNFDFIYDKINSCSYRLHGSNSHKKGNFLSLSLFDIYIKHKEEPSIKKKLLQIVDAAYLQGNLAEKHKTYLLHNGNKTFKEKLILRDTNLSIYSFILSMRKIFYGY